LCFQKPSSASLFDEVYHPLKIRVARTESACDHIPAATTDRLTIYYHIELPKCAGPHYCINAKAVFD
jgi:hypothetical protein